METYTEKALKAIADGTSPAEQAAMEQVITAALKRAIRELKRQDQQQALHNTALLMENYRALKGYEQRAVDSAEKARQNGADIQGEAWLRSIRKNKARTEVMLAHLDAALEELEKEAKQKGRAYMFNAYRMRYIEGLTAEEVAERMNTGKNTPGRWCKQLNERLAVLLFGVDGLRKW